MPVNAINAKMWCELAVATSSIAAWMMILMAALMLHYKTKQLRGAALWVSAGIVLAGVTWKSVPLYMLVLGKMCGSFDIRIRQQQSGR